MDRIAISLVAGLSLLFAITSIASAVVHPPDVNPDAFSNPTFIDNPYYPLEPGTLFIYEGERDGVPTRTTICVTQGTKTISPAGAGGAGVVTRVVHDQAFEWDGNTWVLVEDTDDWFGQDDSGNVLYFGEDTIEPPTGSTEGSWEAGVNDADAGFIMLADPQVGTRYYQEFARNVAEDQAKVLSRSENVCLASGHCYEGVLLTQETSRLDPGVVERKYYARNVGFIKGVITKGGDERTELVDILTCSE